MKEGPLREELKRFRCCALFPNPLAGRGLGGSAAADKARERAQGREGPAQSQAPAERDKARLFTRSFRPCYCVTVASACTCPYIGRRSSGTSSLVCQMYPFRSLRHREFRQGTSLLVVPRPVCPRRGARGCQKVTLPLQRCVHRAIGAVIRPHDILSTLPNDGVSGRPRLPSGSRSSRWQLDPSGVARFSPQRARARSSRQLPFLRVSRISPTSIFQAPCTTSQARPRGCSAAPVLR